ncbi:2,3-bisphosphoglycerate-dependent phosphoglycerate mutase [Nocardioides terrae]|uniref:2,3-bisphosphoglycerate-dependent phosphoglycerate mutase n=1 Tax=Nocardioides terrae TaxID=574651 RepID=A0A1I1ENV2_9ACTN|nr:2,3-diphosphoglycerate-dependent phosphoglycerate mutase [Nocardioides terrae]SFB86610.1 2,3-bisphosphoglycerate-dependent phosphoglycerate mutase [Nocardioides terrae]
MLVLVRHGESVWNAGDRFAGWADIALTQKGCDEARKAGGFLLAQGVLPDVAHTSALRRAVSSAHLMLDACGRSDVPLMRTSRLNERHYGALQGMRRDEAVARYGAEDVARWRRGIAEQPPRDAHGRAESLADVRRRLQPYVDDVLLPALDTGRTVLVVSHGNALRMLIQIVCRLTDAQATALDIATGAPMLLEEADGLLRRTG